MPYNLRKRVRPDPVPDKPVVAPPKKQARTKKLKKEVPNSPPQPQLKEERSSSPEKLEVDEPTRKKAKVRKSTSKVLKVEKSSVEEKNLLAFGVDSCGELGQAKIGISKKQPILVPIPKRVKQVACGPMHAISLTEDGEVYTYGCNDEGALGRETDGDDELGATPTLVPIDNKVIKVTAGDSHSGVLTENNEVIVFGNFRDDHGSIGLTPECDGKATTKPIKLLPCTKFKDIASGSNHMLLLDVNGVVYSFGVGAQGQLGRLEPEKVGTDGNTQEINSGNRDLFLIPKEVSLKDVDPNRPFVCDAVYAGNFSSFATNTDKKKNRLAGWGLNNFHQLGYKGQKDQLIQYFPRRSTFTCSTSMSRVACGQHHTIFLTRTGRVYSAGRNEYGMLGLDKIDKDVCPAKLVEPLGNSILDISAGINTSFAVDEEGRLYSWGMGGINLGLGKEEDLNEPTTVKTLEGKHVKSVSAGGTFTAVLID